MFYAFYLSIALASHWPEYALTKGTFKTYESCQAFITGFLSPSDTPPGYESKLTCVTRPEADAQISIFNCRVQDSDKGVSSYACIDPRGY